MPDKLRIEDENGKTFEIEYDGTPPTDSEIGEIIKQHLAASPSVKPPKPPKPAAVATPVPALPVASPMAPTVPTKAPVASGGGTLRQSTASPLEDDFLSIALKEGGKFLKGAGESAIAPVAAIIEDRLLHRPKESARQFSPESAPTMANPSGLPGGAGYDPVNARVSEGTAFGRGAGEGFAPGVGGMAGAGFAAANANNILNTIPGLNTNIPARAIITLLAGGAGAFGAGQFITRAQNKIVESALSPESRRLMAQQNAEIQKKQPIVYDAGQAASQLTLTNPGNLLDMSKRVLAQRAIGAGLAAGQSAAISKITNPNQPVDWARVGGQAISGAVLSGDNTPIGDVAHGAGTAAGETLRKVATVAAKPLSEKVAQVATVAAKATGKPAVVLSPSSDPAVVHGARTEPVVNPRMRLRQINQAKPADLPGIVQGAVIRDKATGQTFAVGEAVKGGSGNVELIPISGPGTAKAKSGQSVSVIDAGDLRRALRTGNYELQNMSAPTAVPPIIPKPAIKSAVQTEAVPADSPYEIPETAGGNTPATKAKPEPATRPASPVSPVSGEFSSVGIRNKDHFADALVKQGFAKTAEEAGHVASIADARAKTWAKATGKPAEEWYQTRLAGMTAGSAESAINTGNAGIIKGPKETTNVREPKTTEPNTAELVTDPRRDTPRGDQPADRNTSSSNTTNAGTDLPDSTQQTPKIEYVNPDDLKVMPGMQYKRAGIVDPAAGVTAQLKNQKLYNVDQGGVLTAFRDIDGTLSPVNGHHRTELGQRAERFVREQIVDGKPTFVDVPRKLPVQVLDAKDGWTPALARFRGAMENLRDGKGEAIDAADALASLNDAEAASSEVRGLPSNALSRDVSGLVHLDDAARAQVRNGEVKGSVAAAIGSVLKGDTERIRVAMEQARLSNTRGYDEGANLAMAVRDEPIVKKADSGQMGFEGFDDGAAVYQSTAGTQAKIRGAVESALNKEKSQLLSVEKTEARQGESFDVEGRRKDAETVDSARSRAAVLFEFDPEVKTALRQNAADEMNGKISREEGIKRVREILLSKASQTNAETMKKSAAFANEGGQLPGNDAGGGLISKENDNGGQDTLFQSPNSGEMKKPKGPISDKLPVLTSIKDVGDIAKKYAELGKVLLVRFSASPDADAKSGWQSKNYQTGQKEGGLSTVPMVEHTDDFKPQVGYYQFGDPRYIAQRLTEYSWFGGHPYILEGDITHRGSDYEPIVSNVKPLAFISPEVIKQSEAIREVNRTKPILDEAQLEYEHKLKIYGENHKWTKQDKLTYDKAKSEYNSALEKAELFESSTPGAAENIPTRAPGAPKMAHDLNILNQPDQEGSADSGTNTLFQSGAGDTLKPDMNSQERDSAYADAVKSGDRISAQHLANTAVGIKLKSYEIDRDGAHEPAEPTQGAPAWDLTANGTYPKDVYSSDGLRFYRSNADEMFDDEAYSVIKSLIGSPNKQVTVYRAVEKGAPRGINPGAWVTTVRKYAIAHAKENLGNKPFTIQEKLVSAKDIYTDGNSWTEWGYHPQGRLFPEFFKRDKASPRPLSERADEWIKSRTESESDTPGAAETSAAPGGLDDILNQPSQSQSGATPPNSPRASVEFLEQNRAVLRSLNSPDASSAVHELGHIFRRDLYKDLGKNGFTQEDINHVEAWAGVKAPGEKWHVEAEEKFARAFEGYLKDGKAPTPTLRRVFDYLKDAIRNVYSAVKGTASDPGTVKISPEVRAVFDRLLGGEESVNGIASTENAGGTGSRVDTAIVKSENIGQGDAGDVRGARSGEGDLPGVSGSAKVAPQNESRTEDSGGSGTEAKESEPAEVTPESLGMKMDDIEEAAKKLGIAVPDRATFKETQAEVKARANADEARLRDLLKNADIKQVTSLSPEEYYVGHTRLRELTETEVPALLKQIDNASLSSSEKDALNAKLATALAETDDLTQKLYKAGSEAGRRLAFQKAVIDGPLDGAQVLKKATAAVGGQLSDRARTTLIQQVERAQTAKRNTDARVNARAAASEKRLKESGNNFATSAKPDRAALVEQVRRAAVGNTDTLDQSAVKPANILYQSTAPLSLREALVPLGAYHIEDGVRRYDKWALVMRQDMGEAASKRISDAQLQAIYATSRVEHALDSNTGDIRPVQFAPSAFVEKLAQRLGMEGAANFLSKITDDPTSAPDLLERFIANDTTALKPDELEFLTRIYTDTLAEKRAQTTVNRTAATGPLAELTRLAAEARKAGVVKTNTPKAAKAAPTATELFTASVRQRLGKKGGDAFLSTVDTSTIAKLITGKVLTEAEKIAVQDAYRANAPAEAPPTQTQQMRAEAVKSLNETLEEARKVERKAKSEATAPARATSAQERATEKQIGNLEAGLPPRPEATPKQDLVNVGVREYANGAKDLVAFSRQMKKIAGDDIDPVLLKQVLAESAQKYRQDYTALENIKAEMAAMITRETRTSILDKASSLWKAGLLTSPKTHLVNLTSNLAFQVSEEVSRVPAAIADMARVAIAEKTGNDVLYGDGRTILAPDIVAMNRATKAAVTRGIKEGWEIICQGRVTSAADPFEADSPLGKLGITREFATKNPVMNGYVNGVFRSLSAEDRVFKIYALTRSLEEQARLIPINEARAMKKAGQAIPANYARDRTAGLRAAPTDEMIARAVGEAEVATFNNDNLLSDQVRQVRGNFERETRSGNLGAAAAKVTVDTLLPFDRTPTNVVARTLEYVFGGPKSLLEAGHLSLQDKKRAKDIAEGITSAAFTPEQQRNFATTFGRGSVGPMLIALGWMLADKGVMTGYNQGQGDSKKRDKEQGGAPESALKGRDGKWHQVGRLPPMGGLLAVGATLREQQGAGMPKSLSEAGDRAFGMAATAGITIAGDLPLASTAEDLSKSLQFAGGDPAKAVKGFIGQKVGSVIPAAVAGIAAQMDTGTRRKQDGLLGPLQARTPGLRNKLPESDRKAPQPRYPIFDPLGTITDGPRTPVNPDVLKPGNTEAGKLEKENTDLRKKLREQNGVRPVRPRRPRSLEQLQEMNRQLKARAGVPVQESEAGGKPSSATAAQSFVTLDLLAQILIENKRRTS